MNSLQASEDLKSHTQNLRFQSRKSKFDRKREIQGGNAIRLLQESDPY